MQVIRNAMATKLGSDAEEAQKALAIHGVGRALASKALEIARRQGAFTIWSVVDALTRLAAEHRNAGPRQLRSVTIAPRRYRDEKGEWQDSYSYRPIDLPAMILVLQKVYEYTATTPLPNAPAEEEAAAAETSF